MNQPYDVTEDPGFYYTIMRSLSVPALAVFVIGLVIHRSRESPITESLPLWETIPALLESGELRNQVLLSGVYFLCTVLATGIGPMPYSLLSWAASTALLVWPIFDSYDL